MEEPCTSLKVIPTNWMYGGRLEAGNSARLRATNGFFLCSGANSAVLMSIFPSDQGTVSRPCDVAPKASGKMTPESSRRSPIRQHRSHLAPAIHSKLLRNNNNPLPPIFPLTGLGS